MKPVFLLSKLSVCSGHLFHCRINLGTSYALLVRGLSSLGTESLIPRKMVEPSGMTESAPTGKTRTSVSTWVEILKIPTIRQGKIIENERNYSVVCEWAVDELASKKAARFLKHYAIPKPANGSLETLVSTASGLVIESPPIPVNTKLTCYSPSGKKKAVVVEMGKGDEAHDNLQIWSNDTLEKTYDMKELDLHKGIYTSGAWGVTMAWSPDESKLVYMAEKKVPKSEPFFTSFARRKLNDPEGEDSAPRGHDYDFRQSWGEQLDSAYETVIVVLQPETDVFRCFSAPNKSFPYDIQWAGNNSIVGVALTDSEWRLGVIYCTNREGRIFQCDESGFRYLSPPKRAAMSPRVFPVGDFVVWQDRDVLGPHNGCRRILGRKLFASATDPEYDESANEVQVIFDSELGAGEKIPAVYEWFPTACFSKDGNSLYFLTDCDAKSYFLRLHRSNDEFSLDCFSNFPPNVQAILDVGTDFLLASCSSSTKTPSLELIAVSTGKFEKIALKPPTPVHSPEPVRSFIPQAISLDATEPPSILVEPSGRSSYPLIVIPHGGPHSVFLDSFDHETAYFTKLGFAVLKVNYIGSSGNRRDTVNELPGKIGRLDVDRVHQIVQDTIRKHEKIDAKHVFLAGGSHGGFLVTHLSGQFPGFYKAVVARNPVIDLNLMIGTSDITDWVYVEAGVSFDKDKLLLPSVLKGENAEELRNCSPIIYAHQVACPTLLHLGTKDLRVPMSQGLAYYRALKSYGKDVELTVYEDNHALGTVPIRANGKIQIVEFFNKHADKPIFED